METILIAVLGTSPGILTETVWALAMNATHPVVVDRVVVITTTAGQKKAVEELLTPSAEYGGQTVWEALKAQLAATGMETCGKLIFGPAGIRVFLTADESGHLEDIRTAVENDLAADFILKEVRREMAEDVTLIGSVAGGRKTMSTLLYAVFSLLGRPQDRLTHVLVNDLFESPGLSPRFYFPCTPPLLHQGHNREGKVVSEARSDEAVLELADMPFVRLRGLFQRDFSALPGRFTTLVNKLNEDGPGTISIVFADAQGRAVIDGTSITFGPREHALFAYMVSRAQAGLPARLTAEDSALVQDVKAFLKHWLASHPDIHAKAGKRGWIKDLDLREISGGLGAVRDRLRDEGLETICERLLPNRSVGWDPVLTQITLL